jgi:hypothetical protein
MSETAINPNRGKVVLIPIRDGKYGALAICDTSRVAGENNSFMDLSLETDLRLLHEAGEDDPTIVKTGLRALRLVSARLYPSDLGEFEPTKSYVREELFIFFDHLEESVLEQDAASLYDYAGDVERALKEGFTRPTIYYVRGADNEYSVDGERKTLSFSNIDVVNSLIDATIQHGEYKRKSMHGKISIFITDKKHNRRVCTTID